MVHDSIHGRRIEATSSMHILDRRIAYLTRACGLLRGDFTLASPNSTPALDAAEPIDPDTLNHWPAQFLTAIAQEEDAAFVRRYATLFTVDPSDDPPLVGMFDRLVEVPSLAAYDGVLGRQLDAADVMHIGDLMAVSRQQGGDPMLLTMTDIHPALAVSRWCLVTNAQQYRRFEPWVRLLRTLGTEDFDPLAMQCRVLELRERLREVQLESERMSERMLAAQAADFEQRLHAAHQKQAELGARLSEVEDERHRLEKRLGEAEAQCRQVETYLQNVLGSRSWRLTSPLRRLLGGR
ncbi:MAG: hypothetical protein SNJ67_06095 [Chloracidobacterium sp.]